MAGDRIMKKQIILYILARAVQTIVTALVGVVNNINVTDCEGEEDEDDDDQI